MELQKATYGLTTAVLDSFPSEGDYFGRGGYMFRQTIGLLLLSLIAFGLAPAQANDTDEAYVLESPPIIEIPDGIEVSGGAARAEPLQPTFDAGGSRVYFDLKVDVLTSGDLENFDVIAACIFTASAASTEEQRNSLCGYPSDDPEAAPNPDPSKAISMAWTDGEFRIDGTNSHALGDSTHSTFQTKRTANATSNTYLVHSLKFQFALSHAAINTDDWIVRVVAVSTPTPQQGAETTPAAQRTELLLDTGENACALSYVNQVAAEMDEGVDCGPLDEYGVSFFGGFSSSTSRSVDYGSVNENSSSAERNVTTGDYYANDVATLTIAASDFFSSDDEIPLVATSIGAERNTKQITLACSGDDQLLLSATPADLFSDVPRSSEDGEPEAPRSASEHTCQLHYGFGAVFANSTYGNVVQIGIKDADPSIGPTAEAVEVDPTPDSE